MENNFHSERFNIVKAGNDIHLTPKNGEYSHLLIWLHGFGSSAEEYVPIFEGSGEINIIPEKTKILLLSAPTMPITELKGRTVSSWYDLIDKEEINFNDVIKNSQKIMKIIKNEGKKIGFNQIVVGGFSQGACMSFYVGYGLPFPIGGIISCSGKLFNEVEILKDNENLNVFIGHGDQDDVIPYSKMSKSIERIANKEHLEIHTYKNSSHQITHDEFNDIGKFLVKIFNK